MRYKQPCQNERTFMNNDSRRSWCLALTKTSSCGKDLATKLMQLNLHISSLNHAALIQSTLDASDVWPIIITGHCCTGNFYIGRATAL